MKIKYIFGTLCIFASAGVASYYAGYYKTRYKNDQIQSIIDNYEHKIDQYQGHINKQNAVVMELKSSMPEKDALYLGRAIQRYGHANVVALAMNGLNECPSAPTIAERIRCHETEEAAVMYAAINLVKLGENGKTLRDVIYSRTGRRGQTYMFSWVPRPSHSDTSKHFEHSLKIAGHILGGGTDYANADYGQFYYCNDKYKKNGKWTSGCNWHRSSNNTRILGRLNFQNGGNNPFIKDKEMSKHHFFTLSKQYLSKRGMS